MPDSVGWKSAICHDGNMALVLEDAINCNDDGASTVQHDVFDYAHHCWVRQRQGWTGQMIADELGWQSKARVTQYKQIKEKLFPKAWALTRNPLSLIGSGKGLVNAQLTFVNWTESHFRALLKHLAYDPEHPDELIEQAQINAIERILYAFIGAITDDDDNPVKVTAKREKAVLEVDTAFRVYPLGGSADPLGWITPLLPAHPHKMGTTPHLGLPATPGARTWPPREHAAGKIRRREGVPGRGREPALVPGPGQSSSPACSLRDNTCSPPVPQQTTPAVPVLSISRARERPGLPRQHFASTCSHSFAKENSTSSPWPTIPARVRCIGTIHRTLSHSTANPSRTRTTTF